MLHMPDNLDFKEFSLFKEEIPLNLAKVKSLGGRVHSL